MKIFFLLQWKKIELHAYIEDRLWIPDEPDVNKFKGDYDNDH